MFARLLIWIVAATSIAGCQIVDSPEFETYEIEFRDRMILPTPMAEFVIVLEQLPDGPVERFRNVSHEFRTVNHLADSLVLYFDVVGLAIEPKPMVYSGARQVGDTMFVWYADHARAEAISGSAKGAGLTKTGTTPPDPYLKVKHVEIEAPPGVKVQFFNRFFYR